MGLIARFNASQGETEISEIGLWTYSSGDLVDIPVMSRSDGFIRSYNDSNILRPYRRSLSDINTIVLHSTGPGNSNIRAYYATEAVKKICLSDDVTDYEKTTAIYHVLSTLSSSWAQVLNSRYGKDKLLARAIGSNPDDFAETIGKMGTPPLFDVQERVPDAYFFFGLLVDLTQTSSLYYDSDFYHKLCGMSHAYTMAQIARRKSTFMIDWSGTIYQFAPLELVPKHLSYGRDVRADLDKLIMNSDEKFNGIEGTYVNEARFEYWSQKFPDFEKVTDLQIWNGVDPNNPNISSIGIELMAPVVDSIGSPTSYTSAQLFSLNSLVSFIFGDRSFSVPRSRFGVIAHDDCDPSARYGNSSPVSFDWDSFYESLVF